MVKSAVSWLAQYKEIGKWIVILSALGYSVASPQQRLTRLEKQYSDVESLVRLACLNTPSLDLQKIGMVVRCRELGISK